MAEPTTMPLGDDVSFEAALKELEDIVRRLEQGNVELQQAVSDYERGALVYRHCKQRLSETKARIDSIVVGADGEPAAQPFAD